MRILVCGGRKFGNWLLLRHTLESIHEMNLITAIIHGNAEGADSLAASWAYLRGIETLVFPADWRKCGPSAGPLRNQQMLDEGTPSLVVAFPGGRGTSDMVKRAHDANIRVIEVRDGG